MCSETPRILEPGENLRICCVEIEIIAFIKKGFSSKEIADALKISVKTVEVHRYNILKKLNLKNAAALVNYINNSQLDFDN